MPFIKHREPSMNICWKPVQTQPANFNITSGLEVGRPDR